MNIVNIIAPELPESISEALIIKWYKQNGDFVIQNEKLVDIETDKIILEIPSPTTGIINNIFRKTGELINSNTLIGSIKEQRTKEHQGKKYIKEIKEQRTKEHQGKKYIKEIKEQRTKEHQGKKNKNYLDKIKENKYNINTKELCSPKIRRLISKYKLCEKDIKKLGINKYITKTNIIEYFKNKKQKKQKKTIIPLSNIRKKISERLLTVQKTMAIVTTFNEVNMSTIIQIRKRYGNEFQKKHKVKLGFMSFYVKAVIESLKNYPIIHSYLENDKIVFHKCYNINIAISTSHGLIAPVLKNADKMSFSEIEHNIKNLAYKGENKKILVKDLIGGNFTISNGGVYGSLISTPIINYPQSAILGMHAIEERPIVINGKIKIQPMMYLALSYNHCLIDGKDAIQFLKNIKYVIEDQNRVILNI